MIWLARNANDAGEWDAPRLAFHGNLLNFARTNVALPLGTVIDTRSRERLPVPRSSAAPGNLTSDYFLQNAI